MISAYKKILIIIFLFVSSTIYSQCTNVVWSETFSSYTNGTQTSTNFTTTATDCDDGGVNNNTTNYWGVFNGEFRVYYFLYTNGEKEKRIIID